MPKPDIGERVASLEATLAAVRDFALSGLAGARLVGAIDSPIAGADGNREFLLGLRKEAAPVT